MKRKKIPHPERLYGPPNGAAVEKWRGATVVPYKISAAFKGKLIEMHGGGEVGAWRSKPVHTGEGVAFWIGKLPKSARPLCGARTRRGTPCQARAVEGRERCRLHGGMSTGAKTAEGRARICESNRRRAALKRGGENLVKLSI